MSSVVRTSGLDPGDEPVDPRGGGAAVVAPPSTRGRKGRRRPGAPPPPNDGDSGGGWGDGGGGRGDDDGPPPPSGERPEGTQLLGIWLGLIGVSVLFLVVLSIWVLLRDRLGASRSSIQTPKALLPSTLLLAASSATIAAAARTARRHAVPRDLPGQRRTVLAWLATSLALGLSFLASQVILWNELVGSGFVPASGGYAATFYASTGLHALHVAGGLFAMTAILLRLRRDAHWLSRRDPVGPCALFWHFMGVVWLALFTVLSLFR